MSDFEHALRGLRQYEFTVTLGPAWEPPPPTPDELALDEDARTGRPRDISIHFDGLEYYGQAKVIRKGRGDYSFETISRLRRRLARPPNTDPIRLPA